MEAWAIAESWFDDVVFSSTSGVSSAEATSPFVPA